MSGEDRGDWQGHKANDVKRKDNPGLQKPKPTLSSTDLTDGLSELPLETANDVAPSSKSHPHVSDHIGKSRENKTSTESMGTADDITSPAQYATSERAAQKPAAQRLAKIDADNQAYRGYYGQTSSPALKAATLHTGRKSESLKFQRQSPTSAATASLAHGQDAINIDPSTSNGRASRAAMGAAAFSTPHQRSKAGSGFSTAVAAASLRRPVNEPPVHKVLQSTSVQEPGYQVNSRPPQEYVAEQSMAKSRKKVSPVAVAVECIAEKMAKESKEEPRPVQETLLSRSTKDGNTALQFKPKNTRCGPHSEYEAESRPIQQTLPRSTENIDTPLGKYVLYESDSKYEDIESLSDAASEFNYCGRTVRYTLGQDESLNNTARKVFDHL
jgi:hypothetical protein